MSTKEKFEITFQVGELEYKKIIVKGYSYGEVERKFNWTIGLKRITQIKLL